MKETILAKLDERYDVALLPYSPVQERERVDIRCQIYNDREEETEYEVQFFLDGVILKSQRVSIAPHQYGYAQHTIAAVGKVGTHTVRVNNVEKELVIVDQAPTLLDGGFIMLGPPNDRSFCDLFRDDLKRLTDEEWSRYVDALADMGTSCIIIMVAHQYLDCTAENKDETLRAHYPSKIHPKSDITARDPIAAIMEAAQKHGIHVFLGVGNNYCYLGTPEEMDELYQRYHQYTSFYGWYFACEMNLRDFVEEEWMALAMLTKKARALSPAKPILISPGWIPGPEFLEFMRTHDLFDIIMPQDGVGMKNWTLQESGTTQYLLLQSATIAGKHLWGNCESFNFTMKLQDGEYKWEYLVPRYLDGGMDGEAGFVQQMQAVRPYAEKIMNFMYSGFFTPEDFTPRIGGDKAVAQYQDYMRYRNSVLKGKQ